MMFQYLMVIFGIILASLVSKCSIIRYIRCHLGFCDLMMHTFGSHDAKMMHKKMLKPQNGPYLTDPV